MREIGRISMRMSGILSSYTLRPSLSLVGIALLLAVPGLAQLPPPLVMQSFPTGQKPLGVDAVSFGRTVWAVVANSGENSVSLFQLKQSPSNFNFAIVTSSTLIPGIPSPYGVIACNPLSDSSLFIVTSPSANSISIVDAEAGKVTATIRVGSLPYSAACSEAGVIVSNYGDNSLSVVDPNSFTVTRTIPNVPGSRALRGVLGRESIVTNVWVAGTDANVLTIINPITMGVVTSIPVRGPTFLRATFQSGDRLVSVGRPQDNSIVSFSATRLTVGATISGIPTPQDFVDRGGLGQFVTTGLGNSIARIAGTTTTFIPDIPGAAGLTGGIFSSSDLISPPVANFVLATSPDSNRVFLFQAQPSSPPRQFGAANGASFATLQIAPGLLASIFATTGVSQNFSATSLPLPKTLGGVTLRFGGTLTFDTNAAKWNYSPVGSLEAALLFVGPNQINFQLPPGISPGDSVPAQLTKPDGTTLLTTLRITAAAPGIFTVLQNGIGQAAVLNENNSQNFGTNPAKRGSVIQIYATGAGETDPPLLPGEAAPASGIPLFLTRAQPTVTMGGIAARVLFSGMAPGFVGLWQINAEVPASVVPGSAVSLVVSAGGVSSNTVTIAVE
ncbi:MAG: hypothetical protein A3F68_01225 [Acidobacteria bacterium RIFCSPLOWO2_12_FULL_54_10]|nr:MAG: hypothetical protein A3F68_01225 [Acidobacteria bacterium RIFCSPLOWO2_12_FULL_54_10]